MKTYKPGDLLVNNENKCRCIVVTNDDWFRWMSKESRWFKSSEKDKRNFLRGYLVLFSLGAVRGLHDKFTYLAYDRNGIGVNFFTKIEI